MDYIASFPYLWNLWKLYVSDTTVALRDGVGTEFIFMILAVLVFLKYLCSLPPETVKHLVMGVVLLSVIFLLNGDRKAADIERIKLEIELERYKLHTTLSKDLTVKERMLNKLIESSASKQRDLKVCLEQQPRRVTQRGWFNTEITETLPSPYCEQMFVELRQENRQIGGLIAELKDNRLQIENGQQRRLR